MIGAYHRAVTKAVTGFDGFVAKYMGDGVLVYFGYPEPMRTMPNGQYGPGLPRSRLSPATAPERTERQIGIASGSVMVGDLIGKGSSQEQSIVGETPNLGGPAANAGRTRHARDCR